MSILLEPVRDGGRTAAAPRASPFSLRKLWLFVLGLPKTLLFNFSCLPFRQALQLPVLVSHRVWLKDLSGKVSLADCRTGAVRIGFGDVGIFDPQRSRTIWQVPGHVAFMGTADIGHGSRISVTGELVLGNRLIIAAESAIVAQRSIRIGNDVLISWDVLIIDTDAHPIYDATGNQVNAAMPIRIGNSVWLGCRALVLKGAEIADGVVVAAASTVTRPVLTPNAIVGGNPARVVRENVRWKR
ncbi:MAG TPA: acyltransferase [Burkholderiales bacterium]|nr:acyltransferase [Burkholderiales bacterium]